MRILIGLTAAMALSAAAASAAPKPTRTADDIVGELVGGEKAFSLSSAPARPAAVVPRAKAMNNSRKVGTPVPARPDALDMRVTFALGSADMTEQARAEAREFARALQSPKLATMKFKVEGHTDAIGNRDYNLDLSKRRAQAVVDYLVAQGADGSRLIANGYGFDRPRPGLAPTASGNRRVEFARTE